MVDVGSFRFVSSVETSLSDDLELQFLFCRKAEKLAAAVSLLRRLDQGGKQTTGEGKRHMSHRDCHILQFLRETTEVKLESPEGRLDKYNTAGQMPRSNSM